MVKFQESNASLVTELCVLILEASRKFTHRSKRTESRFYFSFDGVYYIFYFYEAGVEYRGDRCAAPWSQFNGLPQKRIEAEALVGCDTTERGEGCVKSHPLARHPCLPPFARVRGAHKRNRPDSTTPSKRNKTRGVFPSKTIFTVAFCRPGRVVDARIAFGTHPANFLSAEFLLEQKIPNVSENGASVVQLSNARKTVRKMIG